MEKTDHALPCHPIAHMPYFLPKQNMISLDWAKLSLQQFWKEKETHFLRIQGFDLNLR